MATVTKFIIKNETFLQNAWTNLSKKYNPNYFNPNYYMQVRQAGHSKWKNIKHTKEMNDNQRQKVILDIVRRIKVAIELNGGITNPKFNSALQKLLDEGKSKDIPNSTMTSAIQRLEKGRDRKGTMNLFGARVLGGCSLLIETLTDKPKHTRGELQHILKKYGGTIVENALCTHLFDHKGVIYVPHSTGEEGEELDVDKAFEYAVEAGAEEVISDYDDYGGITFKFISEPKELHNVKRELEKLNLKPYESRLEYLPHTFIKIDPDLLEYASPLIDALKCIDSVVNVYDNIRT